MTIGKRTRSEFEGRRTSSPAKLPHLKRKKHSFQAASPHSSSSVSSQPSVSEASALAPTDDGISVASIPRSFPTSPLSVPDTRSSYIDDSSADEADEEADYESHGEDESDDDSRDDSSIIVSIGAVKNRKPTIQALPECADSMDLRERLAAFLPQMQAANDELEMDRAKGDLPKRNMEIVHNAEQQYIEMDLGLGILEQRRAGSVFGDESSAMDETEDNMTEVDVQHGVMDHLMGFCSPEGRTRIEEM